jgi:hypothetical protein
VDDLLDELEEDRPYVMVAEELPEKYERLWAELKTAVAQQLPSPFFLMMARIDSIYADCQDNSIKLAKSMKAIKGLMEEQSQLFLGMLTHFDSTAAEGGDGDNGDNENSIRTSTSPSTASRPRTRSRMSRTAKE